MTSSHQYRVRLPTAQANVGVPAAPRDDAALHSPRRLKKATHPTLAKVKFRVSSYPSKRSEAVSRRLGPSNVEFQEDASAELTRDLRRATGDLHRSRCYRALTDEYPTLEV